MLRDFQEGAAFQSSHIHTTREKSEGREACCCSSFKERAALSLIKSIYWKGLSEISAWV